MAQSYPEVNDAHVFVHLNALFAETPGFIELRTFPPPVGRLFTDSIGEAATFSEQEAHNRRDVFVGVATRLDPYRGGGKGNLNAVRALWCDIDGLADIGAREVLDIAMETFSPPHNLRVWSGGGRHLYWLLDEPWSLKDPSQRQRLETINRGLALNLGGDLNAIDAARIMRVAGTTNWKTGNGREPSTSFIEWIDPGVALLP